MVGEAVRNYLALATGLADVPRQQAVRAARALVSQGEATAGQAGTLAEELIATSRQNRDALARLIGFEVERTLGRLGLATAEEVRVLSERVRQLEDDLRAATRAGVRPPAAASKATKAGKASKTATPATSTKPVKTAKATKRARPSAKAAR